MWWWWPQAQLDLESSLTLAGFLVGMGADVLQGLQDGCRNGRRGGQMGAGGVETVGIGGVGQLDQLAIGGVVGIGATGVVAPCARLLAGDAIGGLVLVGIASVLLQVALVLPGLGSRIEGIGLDAGNGQGGNSKDELGYKGWLDGFPFLLCQLLNSRICSFWMGFGSGFGLGWADLLSL